MVNVERSIDEQHRISIAGIYSEPKLWIARINLYTYSDRMKSLAVFTDSSFGFLNEKVEAHLRTLRGRAARIEQRAFYSNLQQQIVDSRGRVVVPRRWMEHAGLSDIAYLTAVSFYWVINPQPVSGSAIKSTTLDYVVDRANTISAQTQKLLI